MLAWLPVVLIAGTHQTAPAAKSRLDRIWEAADTRMARQVDIWFKEGDYPRLIQLLRFRIEVYPHDYELATDLGWMLQNVERRPEALEVYRRYAKLNPEDPDGPFPEANYYFQQKEYAKVPPLIEPTLAKMPHPNSYRILAHAYERTGKLQNSKRVWELYLSRHPGDEAAKNNLKRVLDKIGG